MSQASKWVCLGWLAALLNLAVSTEIVAQTDSGPLSAPPHIQKLIDEGDRSRIAKDLSQARDRYLEAHRESNKLSEKADRDRLSVATALKAAHLSYSMPDDPKVVSDTVDLLRATASQGRPREMAQMNVILADLALRQKDPKAAIKILLEADWDQFEAAQQPVLKYNLGRAYEMDQQHEEAFRRYCDAIRLNPQFSLAANRAIETYWELTQKDPHRHRNLTTQLINLGLAYRLNRFALDVLAKGQDTKQATALALLFESWAATYPGPKEFLASEKFKAYAKDERTRASSIAIKSLVEETMHLNAGGRIDVSDAMKWFLDQNAEVKSACGTFSIAVGRWLIADSRKEPDAYQALTRFMFAWRLDPENIAAGIESARVLTLDFPGIDPSLLDVIVERCFEEKNGVYFRANKSLHDWNQLEKCHTFLGMIYEKRRVWGKTTDVRSAIFQWQHAVDAHAAALKLDPQIAAAPGLREHLAICLAKTGEKSAALDEYLLAVEGFYDRDDPGTAERLLADARSMGITPTDKQGTELARLEALTSGQFLQPVLVFSVRGLEALLQDAKSLRKIFENDRLQQVVNGLTSAFEAPNGFGGIDKKKPLGFYSVAKAEQLELPTLFIPVSNKADLKRQISRLVPDFKDTNGQWSGTINGTMLYGKISRGYLHVNQTPLMALADPARIINSSYDYSLQTNIAGIPDQYKQQLLSQVNAGRELMANGDGSGNEAVAWLRGFATSGTLTAVKSVIEDGQVLTVGVNMKQNTQLATIDIALTGKPGSGLVKVLEAYGRTQPVFAGIGSESAPFRLVISHPTPASGEQLDRIFGDFRQAIDHQITNDIEATSQNREVVRGQVANAIKLVKSAAKTGAFHSGFVLEPGRDGKVRIIGGARVANAEEANKLIADIFKPHDGPTVNYAGARIQPFKWEPAKSAQQTFGSDPAHVALRENNLWMSFGSDNLKGLESVLETNRNRGEVPPISMHVKPATLILLMEHENSPLVRKAKMIAGTPGDKFDVDVAPIAGGAKVHIEFAIDLFRLSDTAPE